MNDQTPMDSLMPPDSVAYRDAVALGRDLTAALPPLHVTQRLSRLQTRLSAHDSDALLVTDLVNIRYLTGFTGSSARLLVTADAAVLSTDTRYAERAVEELATAACKAEIVIDRTQQEQHERLQELLRVHTITKLGLEADDISWAQLQRFSSLTEGICELVSTSDLVGDLRRTKDLAEVARLARASAIADAALADTLSLLPQRPTERAFASSLERAMADLGSGAPSFDTIVASGPNASRPHHDTGSRIIERGDEVICDFGATCEGYHSDMTRTIYVGEPSAEQKHHFGVVRVAQRAGVGAIVVGAGGKMVDAAARDIIAEAGWAEFFGHGSGHGSGLVIHESPWLGPTSTSELRHGDIVTMEPGVYLPGIGGVRIEDSLVVTVDGPVFLTASPYDLVV